MMVSIMLLLAMFRRRKSKKQNGGLSSRSRKRQGNPRTEKTEQNSKKRSAKTPLSNGGLGTGRRPAHPTTMETTDFGDDEDMDQGSKRRKTVERNEATQTTSKTAANKIKKKCEKRLMELGETTLPNGGLGHIEMPAHPRTTAEQEDTMLPSLGSIQLPNQIPAEQESTQLPNQGLGNLQNGAKVCASSSSAHHPMVNKLR